MFSVLRGTWDTVCDYIFPVFCISCSQEGNVLCSICCSTLEVSGVFCCPVCHVERAGGSCCDACKEKTPLIRHVAMMPLTETSLVHQIIHLYKYEYIESLEPVLEAYITSFFATYRMPFADFIVPVPLHPKRFVERGFNQSERIARMVSRATGIPLLDPLKRVVHTIKQATLDRRGREMNVRNAFAVQKEYALLLAQKNVVLIDDVYTTGSTLSQCASALKTANVREISGWSIARG